MWTRCLWPPDHHHRRVTLDAVAAGKDVYCEKPMSHNVADGLAMVEAVQAGKRIFQAGSQRVSSILYKKAREIYALGAAGRGALDRCANQPQLAGRGVGLSRFRRTPARRPSTGRLSWWMRRSGRSTRCASSAGGCFADYGSGLGGDLFVHLLSGIQAITGMNTRASRAYSSGGNYHFKDGRDFPDLLETVYDYPGMQVHVHCNQNNNDGDDRISIFGSRGTLVMRATR
jgi:predicted dehydrogenase